MRFTESEMQSRWSEPLLVGLNEVLHTFLVVIPDELLRIGEKVVADVSPLV